MEAGAVGTLRELYRGEVGSVGHVAAVDDVLDHGELAACCLRMGSPPAGLTPEEAFGELVGEDLYSEAPSSAVPLDDKLLSLRPEGSQPKPLCELLGPGGGDEVQQWYNSHFVPCAEAQSALEESGVRIFHDHGLRKSGKLYVRLLKRMWGAGMLRFGTGPPLRRQACSQ